jgi:16S rRNA (adenine1518-N6/adenine1519-N6)-dimethyltransferase
MEAAAKAAGDPRGGDPGEVRLEAVGVPALRQLMATMPLNKASQPLIAGRRGGDDDLLARDRPGRVAEQKGDRRPHPRRTLRAAVAAVAARPRAAGADRSAGLSAIAAPAPWPPLREVIARHGLAAKRTLGQHFLLDANLIERIVRQAGELRGRHIVEVGPGPGGLTRALLESEAATVTAVEVDPRAIAAMEELREADPSRLRVVAADALALDLAAITDAPRQIIANLPYNIGSPLLVGWLRQAASWERLCLMFQEEVADRICAAPDTPAYGRLSVLAQWLCRAEFRLRIPPQAFVPPPKIYSGVVVLTPHAEQPPPALFAAMEKLTAAAFGQRRKMLRGSLKGLGGAALLARAEIDPERRAETLGIAEFDRLVRLIA